jgi:hypothetical protein
MWRRPFKQGDLVVFRRRKHTTHPGPRAQDVEATANGDYYSYFIEKFWIVADVQADGRLLLQTRRGKTHVVGPDDPNLRHATLWDRLRYRARFAQLQSPDRPT